ncbi:hypothetical protein AN958_06512 [Leucoagaricus sp. SymC.cos]|nr:hypothetical protein AN958_06512 [Leucoagaricus sp. SymC.cos]
MAPKQILQPTEPVKTHSCPIPFDVIVTVLQFSNKKTIAQVAVLSPELQVHCQRLIFKRLCIMSDAHAEEEPEPNGLRRLLSEPNPEVRQRLCPYIQEVQLGPDNWLGLPPEGRSLSILSPPLLWADLAQLPNLETLHLSWVTFDWSRLEQDNLQHLRTVFSRLRELHLYQTVPIPFSFPFYALLPKLERLDVIDVYQYQSSMDEASRILKDKLSFINGPPLTMTFPPLHHLAIRGLDTMDKLAVSIPWNSRNNLCSLKSMHIIYRDNPCFTDVDRASEIVGYFIQSLGRWLTKLELTLERVYDCGGDLASTGAFSTLIHLTHLNMTLTVDLLRGTLDIAQGPQWLFISLLKSLPAKHQLSQLRLTYNRHIERRHAPLPVALKPAFEHFLHDLGICLASGFIGLNMFMLDVHLTLLGKLPSALPLTSVDRVDNAICPFSFDLSESFRTLIDQKTQISIHVPDYTHVS